MIEPRPITLANFTGHDRTSPDYIPTGFFKLKLGKERGGPFVNFGYKEDRLHYFFTVRTGTPTRFYIGSNYNGHYTPSYPDMVEEITQQQFIDRFIGIEHPTTEWLLFHLNLLG